MKIQRCFILILMVFCLTILGLEAKDFVINHNNVEKIIHCDGDVVTVNGNNNNVYIKGECKEISVPGNNNNIRVEAVTSIKVMGDNNVVTWKRGLDESTPAITNLGDDNIIKKVKIDEDAEECHSSKSHSSDDLGVSKTVSDALSGLEVLGKGTKGTGRSESDIKSKKIVIGGNSQQKTLTLKGEKLMVYGNSNKLKVKGFCSLLQVNGNHNEVAIDTVGKINAFGNHNKVFWKEGLEDEKPDISNLGTGNTVTQIED